MKHTIQDVGKAFARIEAKLVGEAFKNLWHNIRRNSKDCHRENLAFQVPAKSTWELPNLMFYRSMFCTELFWNSESEVRNLSKHEFRRLVCTGLNILLLHLDYGLKAPAWLSLFLVLQLHFTKNETPRKVEISIAIFIVLSFPSHFAPYLNWKIKSGTNSGSKACIKLESTATERLYASLTSETFTVCET